MTRSETDAYALGVRAATNANAGQALALDLDPHAARGIFDTLGVMVVPGARELRCELVLPGQPALARAFIERFRGRPLDPEGSVVEWSGHEALDFLATLYDDAERFDEDKRRRYLEWVATLPMRSEASDEPGELEWSALRADAVAPQKERASDSGYDLTLLEKLKQVGDVELYGTGLMVRPPHGYYFDVVPRSSIIKRGYLLANSVGVIDRGYRGEIMVPLVRLGAHTPPLELPARVVQLVPRPIVHFRVQKRESLDETGRGSGGFGSTGR